LADLSFLEGQIGKSPLGPPASLPASS